jgi:hypothetical protein
MCESWGRSRFLWTLDRKELNGAGRRHDSLASRGGGPLARAGHDAELVRRARVAVLAREAFRCGLAKGGITEAVPARLDAAFRIAAVPFAVLPSSQVQRVATRLETKTSPPGRTSETARPSSRLPLGMTTDDAHEDGQRVCHHTVGREPS